MDYRSRNLKENKRSINSSVELPKNFDLTSPKSAGSEQIQKVKQLELRLNNIVETQKVENSNRKQMFLKLENNLILLNDRTTHLEKYLESIHNKKQSEIQEMPSFHSQNNSSLQDGSLFKQVILSDLSSKKQEIKTQNIKFQLMQRRQLKLEQEMRGLLNPLNNLRYKKRMNQCQSASNLSSKQCLPGIQCDSLELIHIKEKSVLEEAVSNITKRIEMMDISFEGKLKALNDRMLREFNLTKSYNNKTKQDSQKILLEELEKKILEENNHLKTQLEINISRKFSKIFESQMAKINQNAQSLTVNIKKQALNQLQKDRNAYLEAIGKAKMQLEAKIKASIDKGQYSVKREEQVNKNISNMTSKLKADILGEVNRSTANHIQTVLKLKSQIGQKISNFQNNQLKVEKQHKQRESTMLKERNMVESILQRTRKLQELPNLFKILLAEAKKEFDTNLQTRFNQLRNLVQKDIKENLSKVNAQFQNVKNHSENSHHESIERFKTELVRQISEISQRFPQVEKKVEEKIKYQLRKNEEKISLVQNQLNLQIKVINKLEAGQFTQKQNNLAIIKKMGADILDIADNLTLLVSELKPYRSQ